MKDTPKFIQLMAAGTGASYGGTSHLYGLTADGDVYEWASVYNDYKDLSKGTHMKWVKLENQS